MFFRNSIFDTLELRNNIETTLDTLVQFLNSAAQSKPGEPQYEVKLMADEMRNVRTINYNLAVLNLALEALSGCTKHLVS